MIQLSTYAVTRVLASGFRAAFTGGWVGIYSGAPPEHPDLPVSGTLLARIQPPGGLEFSQSGTYIMKSPAQDWVVQGITTGTAAWWRMHGARADPGYESNSHARMDGLCYAVDAPGVGLVLPAAELNITPATLRLLENFLFTI